MGKTGIEWATDVWNPVTGCAKVSQGCKHCYAETLSGRFWAKQYPPNEDGTPRKFTDVRVHPERLGLPLKWRTPRRIFVNSVSDLFHPDVPFGFIYQVFDRMAIAAQHTFLILTKRPGRMLEFFGWLDLPQSRPPAAVFPSWPLPNVWLGVSAEDQPNWDRRTAQLMEAPAAMRFVSLEPLLSDIQMGLFGTVPFSRPYQLVRDRIHWIITGCESGPGARECNPDWARSIRDQAVDAEVPFFLKQLKIGGRLASMPELDGQTWTQYPGDEL